ncbi:MAG: sugar ABC transporter substrate-binding protein [Solirubrobacteraceae bacterium]
MNWKFGKAAVAAAVLGVGVTGCGGSGSTATSSGSTGAAGTAASSAPSTATSAGSSASTGLSAASTAVAAYIGKPSPFPVTDPLKKRPVGKTIVWVDCGTPVCGLQFTLLQPAAKMMGMKLVRVAAGSAANTVSAALDSVVAQKPNAVILAGLDVRLFQKQVAALKAEGAVVLGSGVANAEQVIQDPQPSDAAFMTAGKLFADYVATQFGTSSKAVFYDIPELPFTRLIDSGFAKELAAICPGCSARTVHIPVATIGNTAPSQVVSDLQQNPSTNVAVFGSGEMAAGLPAALKTAGISNIKILTYSPTPTTLQDVKAGAIRAVFGFDLAVQMWTLVDQAARELTGQPLSGLEAAGVPVDQFLTQPDITFNPAQGWTGYPDFPQRFAKLWGVQ